MTNTSEGRRILGIDPGSQITGFGIIEDAGNRIQCVATGTIRTAEAAELPQRLKIIYDNLVAIIRKYNPQVVAIESVFHGNNVQSALKLGHARGVALLAAAECGLQCFEYAPRTIKKGLTGSGAAGKDQVQKMVGALLRGSTLPKSLDATDALAVAIVHAHTNPWLKTPKIASRAVQP